MFLKIKKFLNENKHFYLFIYSFVYLIFFKLVELRTVDNYHNMHHFLDDKIPFNEFFAIPYFLWFFYIGYVLVKLSIKSKPDFVKAFIYIFGGMTIGLVIFLIYPTSQGLRPEIMPRDNVLTGLVHFLHRIDTPTNVCPSLHVYDSVGACIAVILTKDCFNRAEKYAAVLLTVSISLSTLFLKQHSVIDVFWGLVMSAVMYFIVYLPDYGKFFNKAKLSV